MHPMYLPGVEHAEPQGEYATSIQAMKQAGIPIPQIMHLFAFKPAATKHLSLFAESVMRGPSPLSPGLRELIAAFTSRQNDCLF